MSIIKHSTVKGTAYVSVVCAVVVASGISVAMASSAEQSSINPNVVLGSDSTLKSLPADSEQDFKGLSQCILKESKKAEREWRLAVDYVEAIQSGEEPWQLDAILYYLDKYKKSYMNAEGKDAKKLYDDIVKRFELVLWDPKANLEKVEGFISTLSGSDVEENANKVDAFKKLRYMHQCAIDAINSADKFFTMYGFEGNISSEYQSLLMKNVAEPYRNIVNRLDEEIERENYLEESERAEREWKLAVDYAEAIQSGGEVWNLVKILDYLAKCKESSMKAKETRAKELYGDIVKRFELVLGHPKVNLEKVEGFISTLSGSDVEENANKVDAFKKLRYMHQCAIDAINSADVLFTQYGLEEKINPQYNTLLRRAVAEPYNNVVERLKQEIDKEQKCLVEFARKTSDEVLRDLEEAQKVIESSCNAQPDLGRFLRVHDHYQEVLYYFQNDAVLDVNYRTSLVHFYEQVVNSCEQFFMCNGIEF